MPSLIAEFFKRNVTLNMGATIESRPQTAYPEARKWNVYTDSSYGTNTNSTATYYSNYSTFTNDALKSMTNDMAERLAAQYWGSQYKGKKTEEDSLETLTQKYNRALKEFQDAGEMADYDITSRMMDAEKKMREAAIKAADALKNSGPLPEKKADDIFGTVKETESKRGRVVKGSGRITSLDQGYWI